MRPTIQQPDMPCQPAIISFRVAENPFQIPKAARETDTYFGLLNEGQARKTTGKNDSSGNPTERQSCKLAVVVAGVALVIVNGPEIDSSHVWLKRKGAGVLADAQGSLQNIGERLE